MHSVMYIQLSNIDDILSHKLFIGYFMPSRGRSSSKKTKISQIWISHHVRCDVFKMSTVCRAMQEAEHNTKLRLPISLTILFAASIHAVAGKIPRSSASVCYLWTWSRLFNYFFPIPPRVNYYNPGGFILNELKPISTMMHSIDINRILDFLSDSLSSLCSCSHGREPCLGVILLFFFKLS